MKKTTILIVTIVTLFSCSKKDNDNVTPAPAAPSSKLSGHYVVLESPNNDNKSAYINDSTISLLGERTAYRTRFRIDMNYETVSDEEIKIYNSSYTVEWDGNKLNLDDGTTKYVFLKEASMPSAEEWVTSISVESKIQQSAFVNGSSKIYDMTYNGFVYTSGHRDLNGDMVLTKINLNDFSTTDITIPSASKTVLGYGDNIVHVGNNKFWVYDNHSTSEYMVEFSVDSLKEINRILMPKKYGTLYQLGYNGNELYGAFGDELRKWSFVNQEWGSKIEIGSGYRDGLDLDNEYLYLGNGRIIHKYSLNPLQAVAAYDISMGYKYELNGFTLTGNNKVAASVYNYDTQENEIVTITLP